MSFLDYLENVRERPVRDRKKLLFLWSISGTAIIVFLWLINWLVFIPRADYDDLANKTQKGFIEEQAGRVYQGFLEIKNKINRIF